MQRWQQRLPQQHLKANDPVLVLGDHSPNFKLKDSLLTCLLVDCVERNGAKSNVSAGQTKLLTNALSVANLSLFARASIAQGSGAVSRHRTMLTCNAALEKQLLQLAPEVILVLGAAAAKVFMDETASPSSTALLVNLRAIPVFFGCHPSTLLEQPKTKKQFWLTLLQIQKCVATGANKSSS